MMRLASGAFPRFETTNAYECRHWVPWVSHTHMIPFKLSSLFLLTAIALVAFATTTYNVLSYGGAADDATDIGLAITKAYADCVSQATTSDPADTVLLVPEGTCALETPITFNNANYFTI